MRYEEYVFYLKRKLSKTKKKVIFLCIGNNNILWDSIGPRVGTLLKQKIKKNNILGEIDNNICQKKDLILNFCELKNKYIVAIDSALTKNISNGEIFLTNGPIYIGAGVNTNKGIIGDLGIKVAFSNISILNEEKICRISNFIADGIICNTKYIR